MQNQPDSAGNIVGNRLANTMERDGTIIVVSHYEAGQMAYVDNKALAKLQGDLARFVNEAVPSAR